MGDFLIPERLKWFDDQVQRNLFPNAATPASLFEVSAASPITNDTTRCRVEPHHLQDYMASWVHIARRHAQGDWRKFYLSRMQGPELLSRTISSRSRESWQPLLEETFGIFQGTDPMEVTLRFTPFRARWIREQRCHPSQKIKSLSDGSLELSFPVADFREVKMKILQFGAVVKVVRPSMHNKPALLPATLTFFDIGYQMTEEMWYSKIYLSEYKPFQKSMSCCRRRCSHRNQSQR